MDTQTTAGVKVTAKDFFLWAGAMVGLYWSVISFLVLIFEYIDRGFPDLAFEGYVDPYSGGIRFAMASLIVLVPATVLLMRLIRTDIASVPAKADLWVRKWALMLTLFVAGVTIVIDLITLINTFLGGELTTRFILKVLVVLMVAALAFLHFYADLKGYWRAFPARAKLVGYAFGLVGVVAVVAGFFIIGSPAEMRLSRFDEQKVNDLSNIQWQIVNYWQQKEALPETLDALKDPISGFTLPVDPQTGDAYAYRVVSPLAFELCADFNRATDAASDSLTRPYDSLNENWAHAAGETCFTRTIDPERYPPYSKSVR